MLLTPDNIVRGRLSWDFTSNRLSFGGSPGGGGFGHMQPDVNHPFGSVEELLEQLGPSTPTMPADYMTKHGSRKGKGQAPCDESNAKDGEGYEMGKLLKELGVFIEPKDADAAAAPIVGGGGARESTENRDELRAGSKEPGEFFNVVKSAFRSSRTQISKPGACSSSRLDPSVPCLFRSQKPVLGKLAGLTFAPCCRVRC